MALFQKKQHDHSQVPLYSTGLQKTKLIVGLGNPGKQYDGTRHNIGFAILDAFIKANDLPDYRQQKDLQCLLSTGLVGEVRVIAIKPQTYMNLSGESVQKVAHFYKIAPKDIIVVHDELDIQFGQIRSRFGGSDAGHNGIKSISQHIGEDYGRLRVGIMHASKGQIPSADYVLQAFGPVETPDLPLIIQESIAILDECLVATPFLTDTRLVILPT